MRNATLNFLFKAKGNEENFRLITLMQEFEHNELVIHQLRSRVEELSHFSSTLAQIPSDYFQQRCAARVYSDAMQRLKSWNVDSRIQVRTENALARELATQCSRVAEEAVAPFGGDENEPLGERIRATADQNKRLSREVAQAQLKAKELGNRLRQVADSEALLSQRFSYRLRLLKGVDAKRLYEERARLLEDFAELTEVCSLQCAEDMCRRVLGVFL